MVFGVWGVWCLVFGVYGGCWDLGCMVVVGVWGVWWLLVFGVYGGYWGLGCMVVLGVWGAWCTTRSWSCSRFCSSAAGTCQATFRVSFKQGDMYRIALCKSNVCISAPSSAPHRSLRVYDLGLGFRVWGSGSHCLRQFGLTNPRRICGGLGASHILPGRSGWQVQI